MSADPIASGYLFRLLWSDVVRKPRLLPHERMDLDVRDAMDGEGWHLDAHRFFDNRLGRDMVVGYRHARVTIVGRELSEVLRRGKSALVEFLVDKMQALVERIRQRLPPGWRLFGRPRVVATFTSRLRVRS